MRVISGKLKGRSIKGFNILGTRPTMDRVKESLFAMIQNYLPNSICLDLFSGSGNLGIEAISNGANLVYFNDKNKECIKVIKDNINNFDINSNSIITNLDYKEALKYYKNNNIKFDLVFLDPPYKDHIISEILSFMIENELLNNNSLVICEVNNKEEFINKRIILFKEKKYGDKKIIIYKLAWGMYGKNKKFFGKE